MLKAIIPAAGLGTRLLPITEFIPKEMFPLPNKPVIQYVVEEAINSGIKDIIIIINKNKDIIKDYLTSLNQDVKLTFLYQEEQKGLGNAILIAKDLINEDFFAILLADSVISSSTPCIKQIIDTHRKYLKSVINIERVTPERIPIKGMVSGEEIEPDLIKIAEIVEKPQSYHTNTAICARYILNKKIFDYLEKTKPGVNNEIQLTDAIKELLKEEEIYAQITDSKRHDVGDPESYINAITYLGRHKK